MKITRWRPDTCDCRLAYEVHESGEQAPSTVRRACRHHRPLVPTPPTWQMRTTHIRQIIEIAWVEWDDAGNEVYDWQERAISSEVIDDRVADFEPRTTRPPQDRTERRHVTPSEAGAPRDQLDLIVHDLIAVRPTAEVAAHYPVVLEENQRKNYLLAEVLEGVPGLVLAEIGPGGETVKRLRPGVEYEWRYDDQRVLRASFTGATGQQRGVIQALADARFGAGKVVVE